VANERCAQGGVTVGISHSAIHRRAGQLGRLKIKKSVNPIDYGDLTNLKAWFHKDPYVAKNDGDGTALPFRKLVVTDLPAGFSFDRFGV